MQFFLLQSHVFTGKGKKVKLQPQKGVNKPWRDSDSFLIQNKSNLAKTVPIQRNIWSGDDCYIHIYYLEDHSAHLVDDLKEFREGGWISIIFAGGITGDLQVKDTHLHHPLKKGWVLHKRRSSLQVYA